MDKRIFELYKEVRRLRRREKALERDLDRANQNYNALWYRKTQQEVDYNTLSVTIPNVHEFERFFGPIDYYFRPKAEYLARTLSDKSKIKLIDDLFEQGYIQLVEDEFGQTFTIRVLKNERL